MSDKKIDELVEKYEDVVYLVFGLIGFPLFLWASSDIKNIVNTNVTIFLTAAFVILAIVLFLRVGKASSKKLGKFPLTRKFFTAGLSSLLMLPMFGVSGVVTINALLDYSTPVVRTQEIADRHEAHVRSKNRDYFYLYVKPWRESLDLIAVRVDAATYNSVGNGHQLTFRTSTGLLGIEYFIQD